MTKCSVCSVEINTIFLKKILGTYIKDKKGKKCPVCSRCQREFNDKQGILKKLNQA